MLDAGIIRRSSSAYSSAIVPVVKPDGSLRLCIDYRPLNAIMVADAYPLKRIDDIIQALRGAQYSITIDLLSGYWQVPVHPDSIGFTAFTSHLGLFEFLKMPFGLKNAPAWFQREMDRILNDHRTTGALVPEKYRIYLDDLFIWGSSVSELLDGFRMIFTIFRKYRIRAKISKCHF